MVELAKRERVDIAVYPGDLYPNARPSSRAIIEMAALYQRFEAAGVDVVSCNGNHDVPGSPGQPGPVDALAALSGRPLWGITTPRIVTVKGLQIAVLPWAKASALLQDSGGAGDVIARTSAILTDIVRGLAAQLDQNLPAILIGHWPISGCMTSSGMVMVGGEAALSLGEVQSLPFKAVIMGHIHKPQVFPGKPVVLHTGAMERRDFGEEHDARGCYIVDTETGGATWHDLPVRRFVTVSRTLSVVEDIARLYADCETANIADTIVRVKYRANDEIGRQVDHQSILSILKALNPDNVAGIYPEIQKSDRTRSQGLREDSTPQDDLDEWLKLQSNISEADKADARRLFQAEYEEVAS